MADRRIFLDTFFVQALLNANDAHHERAKRLFADVRTATEVVTTEAVLTEIGNALSTGMRREAARFIRGAYATPNLVVVPVNTSLFHRALALYESRGDKEWGLTDCISFVVMRERRISEAATGDRHFRQAGFETLISEER